MNKRDVLWGGVGAISLAVLLLSGCRLFSLTEIPWASLLAMLIVGGIAGGIPYLPTRILSKYQMFWLLLGMIAWGILILWRGERSPRSIGISIAWLVAATGYFVRKWRAKTTAEKIDKMSREL